MLKLLKFLRMWLNNETINPVNTHRLPGQEEGTPRINLLKWVDRFNLSRLGQIDGPKVITTEKTVNEHRNRLKMGSINMLTTDLVRDPMYRPIDPLLEVGLHLQAVIVIKIMVTITTSLVNETHLICLKKKRPDIERREDVSVVENLDIWSGIACHEVQ